MRGATLPAAARRIRPGGGLGRSRAEPGGTSSGRARVRDGPQPLPGPGPGSDDPQAPDGRSLSNTPGATPDPIASLRQRVRLTPGGFASLSFATGMASNHEAALALAQ